MKNPFIELYGCMCLTLLTLAPQPAAAKTVGAEWSISMCYLNAYLPTVNSKEYQAVDVLVDLTPSETAQVQMFTAPGTLFYSDAASCQGDYVQDWVFNGPTDPTYDDVQDFFADYQADLEDYIADYYD